MPEDTVALESRTAPGYREKVRLLTLEHLDGRTSAAKRVRAVEGEIAADLGGDLTEAQRQLARRAAVLAGIIEDTETRWAAGEPFDLPEYLAAVNALRRVLATIGLERRARDVTPDLRDYLKAKA